MMTSTSFAQNRCFSSMFFLKLSSRSRSGGVRSRMYDDVDQFLGCKLYTDIYRAIEEKSFCAMTSTSFAQNQVDQFFVCKLKFDDSGLENYERGDDFDFGVAAPRPGDPPSGPRALPLGGVGGASSL